MYGLQSFPIWLLHEKSFLGIDDLVLKLHKRVVLIQLIFMYQKKH